MTLVREYDLTPSLLAVTHVWQDEGQQSLTVAVKGAPETVLELCKVDDEPRARLLERVTPHSRNGLRALAVASGRHGDRELPPDAHGFELQLLGFLCLADPLRSNVPDESFVSRSRSQTFAAIIARPNWTYWWITGATPQGIRQKTRTLRTDSDALGSSSDSPASVGLQE